MEEALAIGIIEIENVPHRWQILEQTRFGGKVGLHRTVIIVVVTTEVGKYCRFKAATPHALLVERMAETSMTA